MRVCDEQKIKTRTFFARHIRTKKPPKRLEVEELKSQTGNLLNNKTWEQVKVSFRICTAKSNLQAHDCHIHYRQMLSYF